MNIKSKILRSSIALLVFIGLILEWGATPALAAPAKSVLTLSQEFQTDRQGNESIVLLARLTNESGYPLSERSISFFETSELFGTGRLILGSAVTSAVGTASLKYETRKAGEHKFTVVYSGDESSTSAIVDTTLEIDKLPMMPPLWEPTGLERVNQWTLPVVGGVVVVVWGILFGVVFSVVRGIRAGRQKS